MYRCSLCDPRGFSDICCNQLRRDTFLCFLCFVPSVLSHLLECYVSVPLCTFLMVITWREWKVPDNYPRSGLFITSASRYHRCICYFSRYYGLNQQKQAAPRKKEEENTERMRFLVFPLCLPSKKEDADTPLFL